MSLITLHFVRNKDIFSIYNPQFIKITKKQNQICVGEGIKVAITFVIRKHCE